MGTSSTFEIKAYRSIHEIDAVEWDSILDADDVFHTWAFIRVVEDAKVEASSFWYLMFYDGAGLAATAVLSAFTISLDLFIGDNALVRALKRLAPRVFNIRILICGLPASFGQSNLKVVSHDHCPEVCAGVASYMLQLAKKGGIRFLSIKEFFEGDKNYYNGFEDAGFFLANSIPYMSTEIRWDSFDDYLCSLRHPYRRRIQQSLKKAHCTSPHLYSSNEILQAEQGPVWVFRDMADACPKGFYQSYLSVMARTDTKLETLNEDFFTLLFAEKKPYRLLSFEHKGQVLSSAILVEHGDKLTFMLVGRNAEKDAYDSYFNLVYGILSYAMMKGYKRLGLGQTAYWVKQSVGGEANNEYLYFASTRPLVHRILKSCRVLIFPGTKLEQVSVFKKENT